MFWKAIEALHRWERENLPGAETPQGNEIFIWLLQCSGNRRPLKDLYRSSRYSEPTVRAYLKDFIDAGFVEIDLSGPDLRMKFARPTPKFQRAVEEYRRLFDDVASLEDWESASARGSGL